MAFKRPPQAPPPSKPGAADMKVVDELVLKSLEINPSLAGGADPSSALEDLRAEITTQKRPGSEKAAPRTVKRSLGDRRQQTVQLFLEQKTEDFQEVTDEYDARVAEIERERAVERDRAIDEIVGLITVILASGAGATEIEKTISGFKTLLAQLEVSGRDLVREAQRR